MQKTINFTSEKLEKNFQDFLQKRPDINELETDFERKIAFAGSLLFDDNGVSEVAKAGGSVQIGDYAYLDSPIDLIWFDSNVNSEKKQLVFLKYFDFHESDLTNDILEVVFREKIEESIRFSVNLVTKWKESIKNNSINFIDDQTERMADDINQLIQEISDDDDTLFYEDGRVKHAKIDFSLFFIFGNLQKYENRINAIIEESKLNVHNFDKINKGKKFKIHFEQSLELIYEKIIANRFCVEKDYLKIDHPENVLFYKEIAKTSQIKESIIVNVSAKSLHRLWNKPNYKDNLLGLNLRYHVKKTKSEKEIDKHIEDSMNPEINEEFWLKNNGLVIVCSDLKIKNHEVCLKNFSIVNGGQTTANIGLNSNLNNPDFKDFFIATKIIVIKGMSNEPNDDVIDIANKIAEATNSQKPIKKEDLLVNIKAIKKVRKKFEKTNPKISMQTRRGENKPREDWFPEKWQRIEYTVIIQLSAAFDWIMPGKARNQKSKLLNVQGVEEIFEIVLENINTYVELIKFNHVLNQLDKKTFLKKLADDPEYGEDYSRKKGSVNNFFKYCKYFSISLIRILKIFLSFPESIREYSEILDGKNLIDSQAQKEITNWSKKWWGQIKNGQLFKSNDLNDLQTFWSELVLKRFASYFWSLCQEKGSATNVAKNDNSFCKLFMHKVINDFNENKNLYLKNIVADKN